MAITETNVQDTQKFTAKPVKIMPRPTYKASPNISPNPFTGKGKKDAYAARHHVVDEAPATVLIATQTNPTT